MSIEKRLTKLEQSAAAANRRTHSLRGVMTPEEWAAAEGNGFIGPDGEPLAGGVFVLPGVVTPEEWEKAAKAQQAALLASHKSFQSP